MPSRADLLGASGLAVPGLRKLRQCGVIPRPQVTGLGRGPGTTSVYSAAALRRAELIGEFRRAGITPRMGQLRLAFCLLDTLVEPDAPITYPALDPERRDGVPKWCAVGTGKTRFAGDLIDEFERAVRSGLRAAGHYADPMRGTVEKAVERELKKDGQQNATAARRLATAVAASFGYTERLELADGPGFQLKGFLTLIDNPAIQAIATLRGHEIEQGIRVWVTGAAAWCAMWGTAHADRAGEGLKRTDIMFLDALRCDPSESLTEWLADPSTSRVWFRRLVLFLAHTMATQKDPTLLQQWLTRVDREAASFGVTRSGDFGANLRQGADLVERMYSLTPTPFPRPHGDTGRAAPDSR